MKAEECVTCAGTGKVERPKTADHLLTDSPAWAWCRQCDGSGRAAGQDGE